MSLLLRKDCQDLLNQHGLPEHHADIANSVLTIKCECGQPFIIVPGISFSRTNPTKAEIAYAVELLGTWLALNKTNIIKYQKLITKFEGKVRPELPESLSVYGGTRWQGCSNISTRAWHYEYKIGAFTVKFTLHDKAGKLALDPELHLKGGDTSVVALTAFSFSRRDFDAHLKAAMAQAIYEQEKATLEDMKSDLSSCEIK